MRRTANPCLYLFFFILSAILVSCGGSTGAAGLSDAQEAAFISHEDQRFYDHDFFALQLGDQDAAVRSRACLALGRIGLLEVADPFAPDLERLILKDADASVRAMAAFALGEAEEHASVPALKEALKDADASVRANAAEAIAKVGVESDGTELASLLEKDPSPQVRRRILLSGWRLGNEATAAAALSILRAADTNKDLIWPAAFHLTRHARANAANVEPEIIEMLAHADDANARSSSARLLNLMREPNRVAALLDLLLKDPVLGVRVNALRAAGAIGYPGLLPVLNSLVNAPEPHLRLEAANAAGRFIDAMQQAGKSPLSDEGIAAAAGAAQALVKDVEPAVAAAAIRSLAVMADRSPIAADVERLLAADQPLIRAAAVELAVALKGPELAARLQKAFADPVSIVRIAAVEALGSLPPEESAPKLLAALSDSDAVIVASAAGHFQGNPLPEALEPLLVAWKRFESEKNIEAQQAILAAVAAYKDAESAQALLLEALNDPGRGIRLAAARLLRESQGPAVFDKVGVENLQRDVSFYTEVLKTDRAWPRVKIVTNKGDIVLAMDYTAAPMTVYNLLTLAKQGFYKGITIHRVVPDFVAQMGCPRGDGWGGPGYDIRCEVNTLRYDRAAVGMALAGKDTGGSQFFITLAPQPHLDGGYTIFAHVVAGMDVAERLLPGDGIITVDLLEGES